MRITLIILAIVLSHMVPCLAETVEPIKYGDFNSWVIRNIKESPIIGGKQKTLYEIGPDATINGNKAYENMGGSPWATSNVYAKVMGVVKGSNAVYPDNRNGNDRCVKLTTTLERCQAIGIINIDVTVAGSIFLGKMYEPISSTSNPYSKMEMGIPFSRRPKALRLDYKLIIPDDDTRLYSSGFGKKKTFKGHEKAEVFIILQRRWEDKDGRLHAKRVGTGRYQFGKSTNGWVNGFEIPVLYGNITSHENYKPFMGLIPADRSYYAKNSKGEMVPVVEEDWDTINATPTHMLIMASTSTGEAYIGTIGLTFWVDNIGLVF